MFASLFPSIPNAPPQRDDAPTRRLQPRYPPYAILSHTWGDDEVTLQELHSPESHKKRGYAKILACCRQALVDTLEWVWIDTCCIDKTSSVELSEAINSMYAWYRDSWVCYVLLEDVPTPHPQLCLEKLRAARWFTRGWCLQELIAPSIVEFYADDWTEIGTKRSLCEHIQHITGIPESVILHRALDRCTIAQKMSWASNRQTTRLEDEAYCLLGIFGVNMPMLYGEGDRAFLRLQEQIIRQTEDYSFLLWTESPGDGKNFRNVRRSPIFAPRPACFHRDGPRVWPLDRLSYGVIKPVPVPVEGPSPSQPSSPLAWRWDPCQMTSRGLLVTLPSRPPRSIAGQPHPGLPDLVLWTGYMHRQYLVCVYLVREGLTPTERYVRRGDGELSVNLVDAKDFAGFELKPTYLSINPNVWEFDRPRRVLRKDSSVMEMEVALSSSSDSTIAMVKPAGRRFHKVAPNSNRPNHPAQTEIWRIVYCRGIYMGYWPFSLQFEVTSERSPHPVTLTIHVALHRLPGRSTCFIQDSWMAAAHLSPSARPLGGDKAKHNLLTPSTIPSVSDRAKYNLTNGEVVAASIKSVSHASERKFFILRAAVLPGPVPSPESAASCGSGESTSRPPRTHGPLPVRLSD
ncbi:heterokaryon incompatibility protein-domain-containing protein [Stachybotrys elegans]|uniref:Heterokaryon incompatibility protein-domain-containing protein n=1 Tax=Stachybotrys elegans TaxID=80388 RepID=A0A8K0SV38_9HYPO|nr:heterokaryon incompatibility protein-domain-containing protein [Stachybotrys elegans]